MSSALANRWVRAHGGAAEKWLADLPGEIARYSEEWGLKIGEPLAGGSMSVVLAADRNGSLVLKLGVPWAAWSGAERDALRAWRGGPAPMLIRDANDGKALLMERISPGTPLARDHARRLAALLPAAWRAYPGADGLPPLAEAVRARFERAAENRNGLLPAQYRCLALRRAVAMAEDGRGRRGVVHGDLLLKNILQCSKRGLALIDPQPAIGDVAYDLGLYAVAQRPVAETTHRIEALAQALGLSASRVLRWASLLAVAELGLAPPDRAQETEEFLRRYPALA